MLSSRIDHLFATRRLPEQMAQVQPRSAVLLMSQLKALQLSIYHLDAYSERHWRLCPRTVDGFWVEIRASMSELEPDPVIAARLLQDMLDYQDLELALRNSPNEALPSLERYYHLKTCDVRLARRLIIRRATVPPPCVGRYQQAWELYDRVAEVSDDLEGVKEDITTFNGNRFLLGIGAAGPAATLDEYRRFIGEIQNQAEALKAKLLRNDPSLLPFTLSRGRLAELIRLFHACEASIAVLSEAYLDSDLAAARSGLLPAS